MPHRQIDDAALATVVERHIADDRRYRHAIGIARDISNADIQRITWLRPGIGAALAIALATHPRPIAADHRRVQQRVVRHLAGRAAGIHRPGPVIDDRPGSDMHVAVRAEHATGVRHRAANVDLHVAIGLGLRARVVVVRTRDDDVTQRLRHATVGDVAVQREVAVGMHRAGIGQIASRQRNVAATDNLPRVGQRTASCQ
ncbi:hypothetical protein D3C86_1369480 [compost metagenome]